MKQQRLSPGCVAVSAAGVVVLVLFVVAVVREVAPPGGRGASAGSAAAESSEAPGNPLHLAGPHVEAARRLTGLAIGDEVAGARLVAVRPPQDRQLLLDFRRQDELVTLMVARKDPKRPLPPEATVNHAVYVSSTRMPAERWRPILDAVVARIREREAGAGPIPELEAAE